MSLKGSRTEENLTAAFAVEAQANRRYLYFAQKADVEGFDEIAGGFETPATAERPRGRRFHRALGDLGS